MKTYLSRIAALLCWLLLLVFQQQTHAQNSDQPYAQFGYEGRTLKAPHEEQNYMLLIPNPDTLSVVRYIGIAPKQKKYYFYNADNEIILEDTLKLEQFARWLSVDSLAKKYPSHSPYNFVVNSPLMFIDPDGRAPLTVIENENGETTNIDDGYTFKIKLSNQQYDAVLASAAIHGDGSAFTGFGTGVSWETQAKWTIGATFNGAAQNLAQVPNVYAKLYGPLIESAVEGGIGYALFRGIGRGLNSMGKSINLPKKIYFNPMRSGMLPEGVVKTFRGGSYAEVVSDTPVLLYRVYGKNSRELGGFWTRTKPSGPVQSIIDSALNPKWGNNATKVTSITLPPRVTFFEGVAAKQGGLVGGGNQVFIPEVKPEWLNK